MQTHHARDRSRASVNPTLSFKHRGRIGRFIIREPRRPKSIFVDRGPLGSVANLHLSLGAVVLLENF